MAQTITLSSKNRVIQLETPLPKDELVAEYLFGTETLSRMFEYELTALSYNGEIKFDEVLGRNVSALIETMDSSRRAIDGRVVQIGLIGMSGNAYRYRLALRPWTWMLTRTSNCRIFQEQTVEQILKVVFAIYPHVEFNLNDEHPTRTYCVQYRETDFDFVSRLMEEEGIYYFFRHEKGNHTMVICDPPGVHPDLGSVPFMPQQTSARFGREYIRDWSVTREIQPGRMMLNDFNFETPRANLKVSVEQARSHAEATHEVYDYPGEYPDRSGGEQLVQMRLEEMQAHHEIAEGRANARVLACGGTFTLTEFGRSDQNEKYLIVSTTIEVRNNTLESSAGGDDSGFDVSFRLLRATEPFRPQRTTPRPIVKGPQTAIVVGPAGEEICVDKYGRVKLQFHWDRDGVSDDKSSCWVRVSQIWAGRNFGWMSIPRIGQEVVVDFLEGNPDEPLVTGRVYNADNMPPWGLPANKTQSGLLTRSTLEGSPANANEFRFEDKKGSEQVYLHAEKNQDIEVENDETHWVGHDRKKTIDNDETTLVKHDRTETVGNNETITVVANRTESVGKNETIAIGVNRTETVGSNETISIGASRTESVGKSETVTVALMRTHTIGVNDALTIGAAHAITVGAVQTITVGAAQTTTVGASQTNTIGRNQANSIGGSQSTKIGKDQSLKVGGSATHSIAKDQNSTVGDNRSASVGKDDALKVGKNLVIDAGDSITIKTGSASISMKKDGTIVIKGKDIKVEGSGNINIKASSDIVMKGSKIQQN